MIWPICLIKGELIWDKMFIHSKHYFIARPWKNIERGKLSADTEINIITMTGYIIIIKDNLFI